MNTIPVGTKVCDKHNSSIEGTIVSGPVTIETENQTDYVIRLERGFWGMTGEVFISHLLINESNIEILKKFR